jgi:exopolysaccharide biosynthesis predicted pyruvyltransferase EpsI
MDDLEKVLFEYRNKKFVVIEPGGNSGDHLIYLGLKKKLRQLKITYCVYKYKQKMAVPPLFFDVQRKICKALLSLNSYSDLWDLSINRVNDFFYEKLLEPFRIPTCKDEIILIQGGGNIGELYKNGTYLLKTILHNNKKNRIIVAPQSYFFKSRGSIFSLFFRKNHSKILLFCREKYSYDLLQSLNLPKNVSIFLSPCTAFYLAESDFQKLPNLINLFCFRNDCEKRLSVGFTNSLIKSIKISAIVKDIASHPYTENNFSEYLYSIQISKRVFTDRLHVAILAAVLKKEVVLFANSYWKNKGVYEYTLKEFQNVQFVEDEKVFNQQEYAEFE